MFKGVLLASMVSAIGAQAAESVAETSTETKEFAAKELIRLEISNQIGHLKFIGEASDKIVIKAEKIKFGDKCALGFKQTDKVLEIDSGRKSMLSHAECEVNYTITLPKRLNLQVRNVTGPIDVSGTKGELDIKVGSGNIQVKSVVEELNAIAGKGTIDVQGLVGDATVKLGSGTIKLGYSKDPGKGELDIKSGSGDATVIFPPKMRVHSRVLIGSGDAYNELGDFEDAKFHVSFKAGSGNLNIKSSNKAIE